MISKKLRPRNRSGTQSVIKQVKKETSQGSSVTASPAGSSLVFVWLSCLPAGSFHIPECGARIPQGEGETPRLPAAPATPTNPRTPSQSWFGWFINCPARSRADCPRAIPWTRPPTSPSSSCPPSRRWYPAPTTPQWSAKRGHGRWPTPRQKWRKWNDPQSSPMLLPFNEEHPFVLSNKFKRYLETFDYVHSGGREQFPLSNQCRLSALKNVWTEEIAP